MTTLRNSTRMQKNLQKTALSMALVACFVGGGAQAQSNASGTIFGSAEPGSVLLIQNPGTGLSREVSVDSAGRYRVPALPVGDYKVTLQKDGRTVAVREGVSVLLGAGSEVSFGTDGQAQTLETIVVTSASVPPVDISTTDTRLVFTAEKLEKMSVGRSIEALSLLTPGVIGADSRYPNTASFGGSAASENAFYINGYPVTNPLTNLGSTTLPFDGISQFQAHIGGWGAEFGRTTGGVVNIITKRGTNEWKAGGQVTWAPRSLRGTQRSIYFPNAGTASDGRLYQQLRQREVNELQYGAYVGGPIVKDKLFFYASGEWTKRDVDTVNLYNGAAATNYRELRYDIPRWLVKLDWSITDNHFLEFTGISDVTKDKESYYRYAYTGPDAFQRGNTKNGGYYYEDGGELYIGKYTGYFGDNLTVTALYGQQEQDHIAIPAGYDRSRVYVSDTRAGTPVVGLQPYAQLEMSDAYDKTKGGRFDIDWRVGDHTLRLGYDRHDSESRAGEATSGPGYRWAYATVGSADANSPIPGSGGARGPGGNGDYVQRIRFANGGTFEVKQYAYYLEDRWQVSDKWLLTLGLRNENFENYNSDGVVYVEQKDQWAPRLGASWDVHGDSSLKVFANLGRYHLAMPNNVARRAAAGSLFTTEYFSFTGVDPATGEPLGVVALGNGPYSANGEYGQAKDPLTVAAKGLDSHFQDEFILGFEKALGADYVFGARYVYRDLKGAIDDICDPRPAYLWARRNNFSEQAANAMGYQLQQCRLFNPGESNTFVLNDGTGRMVTVPLSVRDLAVPKLKRRYQAVDLFLEHPFDGTWYYRVDYTWARNYGNAEGQLKSDIGQTDVSVTQDWDFGELMEGASGYLPNDRRHQLKAYGFFQLSPEWRFSGTLTALSGRPRNCTGVYAGTGLTDTGYRDPEGNSFDGYAGPYYRYCNGRLNTRGAAGRLPWSVKLDLGVNYAPAFADHKLQFGLDVFNVTDSQPVQNMVEYGEIGRPGNRYPQTNRAISYLMPRSVRFSVKYDF